MSSILAICHYLISQIAPGAAGRLVGAGSDGADPVWVQHDGVARTIGTGLHRFVADAVRASRARMPSFC